jgi:hypothetical protein
VEQRGSPSSVSAAVAVLLGTPLPLLLLLLIRPWRWHRRYSDLLWLAPAVWFGVPLSWSASPPAGPRDLLPAFPFLALLAAAAWDVERSRRWRQVATALVLVAIAAAVWLCPRYLSASEGRQWRTTNREFGTENRSMSHPSFTSIFSDATTPASRTRGSISG